MKSETILYGEEILILLDENPDISFEKLEEKSKVKGEELRKLLRYLEEKGYSRYHLALFVNSGPKIGDSRINLLPKGMEVVLGKKDFFEEGERPNQINVNNSSGVQVAQTTGENASISQVQNNSQIVILKRLIEDDPKLNSDQKTELKSIVDKIKEGISTGEKIEKVYEWVKRGIGVCAKYGPYLFELIKGVSI